MLDLVGYADRVGGLDQVVTVLTELAEKIDPEKLAAAARTAPLPWAQRLGYLLERAAEGGEEKTSLLKVYVRENAKRTAALLPAASENGARRDRDWKLPINAEVEAESLLDVSGRDRTCP